MVKRINKYRKFLESKNFSNDNSGFEPLWLPKFLYDFQEKLTTWAIQKGKAAIFADCGLGKTPMQLVWAQNIVQKTNGKILIITPLAVSHQTLQEANKFGIKAVKTQSGTLDKGINITNYERLKNFEAKEINGIVCDESSILKNFDGKTRRFITDFVHHIPYRLLCTATPAPNDFMELGTSSEALNQMTYNQMLGMFFINKNEPNQKWILKSHGQKRFWQWVSTWARAIRKPSDLNCNDDGFILPKLNVEHHRLKSHNKSNSRELFPQPAITLNEQRAERSSTIKDRCEYVASLIPRKRPFLIWCHLNNEGALLEHLIPDSIQVSGSDDAEIKEQRLIGFSSGEIRVLITKPRIGGFGLNWQHCSDMSFFPSHSHEQFYQASRRCWRFGQTRQVNCHIVATERESLVVQNMIRTEKQANEMYDGIVREMTEFQIGKKETDEHNQKTRIPKWL
jgi:SNF2 family DNA or RNA helicase